MTKPLRALIEIISESTPKGGKILEIGSRQEKNQKQMANLRPFFKGSEYLGIDMRPGPGVDRVVNGNKLPFKDGSFDLILCLETFEHADKPWLVASEIERVLSRGGIAIVSSQQNFPIHMHPADYFRYTPYGLAVLFPGLKQKFVATISPAFDNEAGLNPQAVILIGKKSKSKSFDVLKKGIMEQKGRVSIHKPYRHRLLDGWKLLKRAIGEAHFRQELEIFEV